MVNIKKTTEYNSHNVPSLVEEIEYKQPAEKWRPTKKFLTEILVNLDAGKTKGVYYTPKTAEEEEKISAGLDEQFRETVEYVLGRDSEEDKKCPPISDEEYRHALRKEKFTRAYSNLPLVFRQDTVLVLDKYGPISWDVAFTEIEMKTPIGGEILKKLEKMKKI